MFYRKVFSNLIDRRMGFLFLGLCLLLGACTSEGTATETGTPSEQPTIATETAMSTATAFTPSATAELTEPADPSTLSYSPVFLFLQEGGLMTQVGEQPPQIWEDAEDLGEIGDAVLAGRTVYLLREQGFQKLSFVNNQSEVVARYEIPMAWGNLFYSDRHPEQLYYTAHHGDMDTRLGVLDLVNGNMRTLLDNSRSLHILGLTEDGQGLYVLPVGQDTSFRQIFVIDLERGEIAKDLPIQAEMFVAFAPDSRLLATFSADYIDPNGEYIDYALYLYDLPSLPLSAPQVFSLPLESTYVGNDGLHWAPGSEGFYFTLIEDLYNEPFSESYGVWYLNVETGEAHQVASPVSDSEFSSAGISPDGEWMLFRPNMSGEASLLQLQTGETVTFAEPLGAIFAGWQ